MLEWNVDNNTSVNLAVLQMDDITLGKRVGKGR